jgi:hypothetical protein
MKLDFSEHIFEKYSNIKFHENPSSGSHVVPRRRMDGQTDKQTDMKKLTVTFCNFVNLPNNITLYKLVVFQSSVKGHTLQDMLNRARLPALTAQTSMPVNILKITGNKKDMHEVAFNGSEFLSSLDYTVKGVHHCLYKATDDSIHSAMIGPVTK